MKINESRQYEKKTFSFYQYNRNNFPSDKYMFKTNAKNVKTASMSLFLVSLWMTLNSCLLRRLY